MFCGLADVDIVIQPSMSTSEKILFETGKKDTLERKKKGARGTLSSGSSGGERH